MVRYNNDQGSQQKFSYDVGQAPKSPQKDQGRLPPGEKGPYKEKKLAKRSTKVPI